MSRRWIWREGMGWCEVPLDWKPTPRPRLAVHGVKQPFRSMADGKMYDDTRTYEREVKARGYEVIGNEQAPFSEAPKPPPVEQDILRAAEEISFKW